MHVHLFLAALLAVTSVESKILELQHRQTSCTDPDVSNPKDAYNNAKGGQLILDNLVRMSSGMYISHQ
jgi:hypothetical protein